MKKKPIFDESELKDAARAFSKMVMEEIMGGHVVADLEALLMTAFCAGAATVMQVQKSGCKVDLGKMPGMIRVLEEKEEESGFSA